MELDPIKTVIREEYQIQGKEYKQDKNVLSKIKKINKFKNENQ